MGIPAKNSPEVSPRSLSVHNPRKRVLIINVFMDDRRTYTPNPFKVPQALAPVYLAGAFSRSRCQVQIYNEHLSGPLKDPAIFAWPDMVVLTGVLTGFDRMLHMVAYAKTLNPAVITVAGGPAIRAIPEYAKSFFDYPCLGDVEEIQKVIAEAWGREYTDPEMNPRHDLLPRWHPIGYLESSRNCNFRCGFCSLTAERNEYRQYSLKQVESQLLAMKRHRHLVFIDNNFYGDDRDFYLARTDLLRFYYRRGAFKGWSALVTQDFFLNQDNLDQARSSGCESLFSGVESFDLGDLETYRKRQNMVIPQTALIHKCMEAGIVFHYGLMFDPSRRRVGELRGEIEGFLTAPGITLPSFISLTIPLLGTPYFEECVRDRRLLPRVKLRDLDGFTQTLAPLDSLEEVAALVRDLMTLRGYRRKILRKAWEMVRGHGASLTPFRMGLALASVLNLCAPQILNSPGRFWSRPRSRTYISTTEPLDPQYRPQLRVASGYENHFLPTLVTDEKGELSETMLKDYRSDGARLTGEPPPLVSEIGFFKPNRVEPAKNITRKRRVSKPLISKDYLGKTNRKRKTVLMFRIT